MNVSTDTCILINLLRVHRLDLLGTVSPYVFFVPTEVLREITYPDQIAELNRRSTGDGFRKHAWRRFLNYRFSLVQMNNLAVKRVHASLWQRQGIGYSVPMIRRGQSGKGSSPPQEFEF